MRKAFITSLTLTLLILSVTLPASALDNPFSGEVVGVLDGDTIDVLVDRSPVRVRLHGIDCPEKSAPFGNQAKKYASDLAFKKTVTVHTTDVDRYGRIVGEVILPDDTSLNRELVRAGYAWWYQKYAPDDKELKALEETARASQRGLWADPNPIPPWEWRRGARAPSSYQPEQPRSPPTAIDGDTIVYITRTGKKYHQDGCRHLGKTRIPITLEAAESNRFERCSICID